MISFTSKKMKSIIDHLSDKQKEDYYNKSMKFLLFSTLLNTVQCTVILSQ